MIFYLPGGIGRYAAILVLLLVFHINVASAASSEAKREISASSLGQLNTSTSRSSPSVANLEHLSIRDDAWHGQSSFLPGQIIRLGMNGTVKGPAVTARLWWDVVDSLGNPIPELSFANYEATIGPGFWGYNLSPIIPSTLSAGRYIYRGEVHYNGRVLQRQTPFTIVHQLNGNMLVNGDYEQDDDGNGMPDFWSMKQQFTRSNEAIHGGSYAAKHFASNETDYRVWQWMPGITANAEYDLSGYVNIPSTSDAFSFELEVSWWSDGGTKLISTVPIKTYTASTNGSWDVVDATLVAPPSAQSATLRMVMTSLRGPIYVDDFSFRLGS